MQVILMEKLPNVGDLGEVVKVKPGFARNFLIPQGKAKRATPENLKLLEGKRAELEKAAIRMPEGPLKHVGEFPLTVVLHTDVSAHISVTVVADTTGVPA